MTALVPASQPAVADQARRISTASEAFRAANLDVIDAIEDVHCTTVHLAGFRAFSILLDELERAIVERERARQTLLAAAEDRNPRVHCCRRAATGGE